VIESSFMGHSWVIESSRNANLFCSPKERMPHFQGQGVVPHCTICLDYVTRILMVVGAFSPWAWAAVHLPVGRVFVASLLAFVFFFVAFCILLSSVAEGGLGGVPAEYGRFLQAFLIWQSSALAP